MPCTMMDARRADLHTHTEYSDGCLTPAALVDRARQCGLQALAITDHDTVDGLVEGQRHGAGCGVEVIAGVEMSVMVEGEPVHLLGYLFDPFHAGLRSALEDCCRARIGRAGKTLARLRRLGVDLDTLPPSRSRAIGRPHIAEALVAAGLVGTTREAFDRYLADGRPAYEPHAALHAVEALRLLHEAGGIAVLAHPGHRTSGHTIQWLVREGMDGLETVHPSHDELLTRYYRQLARDMGILETGGSDFHKPGPNDAMGRVSVPYAWINGARAVAAANLIR